MSTNQYSNRALPFHEKIVMTIAPNPCDDISKIIENIASAFKYLYGIIIILIGSERVSVILSEHVRKKTIETAYRLLEEKNLENELVIVPFPKK
ncbi:MAG: hypothetical protein PHD97_12890 [Bacteroidales bacterium]|nr:hypothetical protein [Bacteroidales bacterium]